MEKRILAVQLFHRKCEHFSNPIFSPKLRFTCCRCSHIFESRASFDDFSFDFTNNTCVEGCHSDQNWVCLSCKTPRCSRYANGHNILHWRESGHSLALSISDLSIWCYACSKYIKSESLSGILSAAYAAKFPAEPRPPSRHQVFRTGVCYDPITERHLPPEDISIPEIYKLENPSRISTLIERLSENNVLSR